MELKKLKQPLQFCIFFDLFVTKGCWRPKYLCHCNKSNSGWILKHCIVISLQQIDLCEQLLVAACFWGHASSACKAAKQIGLFLWETVAASKVSIHFASSIRPPSNMLTGPAADLTVESCCLVWGCDIPLQKWRERHPLTFSLWRMYINITDSFLMHAAATFKHTQAQVICRVIQM